MSYIDVRDLTVGYEGQSVAEHISFHVNPGDYLCIVGENGSGKSTLMKTILHLVNPMKGEIVFDDGLTQKEIGYLPQQTAIQRDFPASVKEIVLSGFQGHLHIRPFYRREEKQKAMQNLERMGIAELASQCYRDLSGGQQQRVLLARALCAAQKLLLLDEPVSGLDPRATAEMYELIRQLNEDGIAIIMISHDISSALAYATHILHMGSEVFFGTKEAYRNRESGGLHSWND